MVLAARYIRRHWGMALASVLFLTVETLSNLLQPMLMSKIVDDGVARHSIAAVISWGWVMLAVAVAGAIGAVVRSICSSRVAQLVGRDIRSDTYGKVMSLPFESIYQLQPGAIITRITNDVTQIQNFTQGLLRVMLRSPITCIGAITLIIIQIPRQAPIVAIMLVISAVFIATNMSRSFPRFLAVQQALDRLGTISRQFLRSIRVVKAFGAERQEAGKFDAAARSFATANTRAGRVNATYGPLINLTVNCAVVALLWISRFQHPSQIGALMASMNYMTQILFSLNNVGMILNASVRANASARRIGEIFEQPGERRTLAPDDETDGAARMRDRSRPAQPQPPATPALHIATPALHIAGLSYRYVNAADDALHDVNLDVERGTMLGIIGSTGSGKSTLFNLLPRFYTPTRGYIELDGHNIATLDVDRLRARISLVPQEPVLFSGTVRSNLLWGNDQADEQQLSEALRLSCADEFVGDLQHGLDERLRQGGVNLSGGQKQRLSLARALTRHPDILILDDCTSALDADTEQRVLQHLAAVSAQERGMTVLLISQRISTVRRCSRIAVMDHGTVVATGTHDMLLNRSPRYREIFNSQIGDPLPTSTTRGDATSTAGGDATEEKEHAVW